LQPPDPYSPYAPPAPLYRQNVLVPAGANTGPLVGPGLRNAKLALGIAQVVTGTAAMGLVMAGAIMGSDDGTVLVALGGAVFVVCTVLLFVWAALSLMWVYKFWSWLPPEQRHASLWKRYISPSQATFFMLIPYFGIFWMFVVYLGIADALERMRVAYPTDKPPAKTIALVYIIVPLVFFPAAPLLEYFFCKHVEGMATDMQARMPALPQ
jgi:hypothetical protein